MNLSIFCNPDSDHDVCVAPVVWDGASYACNKYEIIRIPVEILGYRPASAFARKLIEGFDWDWLASVDDADGIRIGNDVLSDPDEACPYCTETDGTRGYFMCSDCGGTGDKPNTESRCDRCRGFGRFIQFLRAECPYCGHSGVREASGVDIPLNVAGRRIGLRTVGFLRHLPNVRYFVHPEDTPDHSVPIGIRFDGGEGFAAGWGGEGDCIVFPKKLKDAA